MVAKLKRASEVHSFGRFESHPGILQQPHKRHQHTTSQKSNLANEQGDQVTMAI